MMDRSRYFEHTTRFEIRSDENGYSNVATVDSPELGAVWRGETCQVGSEFSEAVFHRDQSLLNPANYLTLTVPNFKGVFLDNAFFDGVTEEHCIVNDVDNNLYLWQHNMIDNATDYACNQFAVEKVECRMHHIVSYWKRVKHRGTGFCWAFGKDDDFSHAYLEECVDDEEFCESTPG